MKKIPGNIIISRTDSIGDVVLTIPVAAVLKQKFPHLKIAFMGRAYTRAVIEACIHVDEFIDVTDFMRKPVTVLNKRPDAIIHVYPVAAIANRAKQLHIPLRIGTTNRFYHWFSCNKLVKFSRKKSNLHEAQLNLKLLQPFGIIDEFSLQQLIPLFGLEKLHALPEGLEALIQNNKYNLILHPKSQGSAREWGLDNFVQLIQLLDKDKYQVFISGTAKERALIQPLFDKVGDTVTDITGLMNLNEFMAFIARCDGLAANSTGPLHIAAVLGKDALGIYPPMHPIHPGRWAPIGKKAAVFVLNKFCNNCRSNPIECACIREIQPLWLKAALDKTAAVKAMQQ